MVLRIVDLLFPTYPRLTTFSLFPDGTGSAEQLQPIDYVLITLVFLGIMVGTYVVLRRICSRVSTVCAHSP
jgi:hypothetical protein